VIEILAVALALETLALTAALFTVPWLWTRHFKLEARFRAMKRRMDALETENAKFDECISGLLEMTHIPQRNGVPVKPPPAWANSDDDPIKNSVKWNGRS
jgi:hypothetical protein